jgi:hypothetical protein
MNRPYHENSRVDRVAHASGVHSINHITLLQIWIIHPSDPKGENQCGYAFAYTAILRKSQLTTFSGVLRSQAWRLS